jgi:hypothetical protein
MNDGLLGIEATGGGRALHARRRVAVTPSEHEARVSPPPDAPEEHRVP